MQKIPLLNHQLLTQWTIEEKYCVLFLLLFKFISGITKLTYFFFACFHYHFFLQLLYNFKLITTFCDSKTILVSSDTNQCVRLLCHQGIVYLHPQFISILCKKYLELHNQFMTQSFHEMFDTGHLKQVTINQLGLIFLSYFFLLRTCMYENKEIV